MTEKMIPVPEKEYHRLVARSKMLEALEAAGVDNWDGCEYAHELLEEL